MTSGYVATIAAPLAVLNYGTGCNAPLLPVRPVVNHQRMRGAV